MTDRKPLLPDRSTQTDFFVCDIFDASPKSDMASMAHPIFSLSTKPDRTVRRYENGDSYVQIAPSHLGLATVHDRDVLIYCISQLMAAINEGREVSRVARFKAVDLLIATNRPLGGDSYQRLKAAFDRLAGTRLETNITTNEVEIIDGFGLIDRFRIVRETRDGRMLDIEITLSDWVFNAIEGNEVLTLHRDYFRLRKPLERRLYELARKHCGKQSIWRIKLKNLQEKCGSSSTLREFRRLVNNIVEDDSKYHHMPDYNFSLVEDMFEVRPKAEFEALGTLPSPDLFSAALILKPDTHAKAREVAQGWDIYALENEWRDWVASKKAPPKDPDAAFIAFCRKKGVHPQVA